MPDSSVSQCLASLPTLGKAALCELWKQLFDVSPNPKLRRDLMVPLLAYRLQGQAFERIAGAAIPSAPNLGPGTRLVREWRDQVHLVNVEDNGYEYHGARYQSLSEIARLITGTRWSGPLFFGIKNDSISSKAKEGQ